MGNCRDCGTPLSEENTYRNQTRRTCRSCLTARVAAHDRELNERTRETADNYYQRWEAHELELLLQGIAEGTSLMDLAVVLGRTRHGVATKLNSIRRAEEAGDTVQAARRAPSGRTTPAVAVRTCTVCFVVVPCFCD